MTDTMERIEAPDFAAIERAAARIAPFARPTPVLRSSSIDAICGASVFFKCENLQRGGAFKFRGACNAVWSLADAVAARGVVTHSSGNHGAALALAASTRGIAAHVVVPEGAVAAKIDAIQASGATLHRCAATIAAREHAAAAISAKTGATLIHPYANVEVIAGQGTATLELLHEAGSLDAIVVPVGGGGLACGTAIAAHGVDARIDIHGAEPEGAADAADSLHRGVRVTELVPQTVCDGLRGLLGAINFELMRQHRVRVTTVSDADTLASMRLLWERLKIVVEASSAIALAGIFAQREHFAGRRIGVILSGGNVDLEAYFGRLSDF